MKPVYIELCLVLW